MSIAAAAVRRVDLSHGELLEMSEELVAIVQATAERCGFSMAVEERRAIQALLDVDEKVKVLFEASLVIDELENAQRLRLELFWFGFFVYWLAPKHLSWLSARLGSDGLLTQERHRKLSLERKRLIDTAR